MYKKLCNSGFYTWVGWGIGYSLKAESVGRRRTMLLCASSGFVKIAN